MSSEDDDWSRYEGKIQVGKPEYPISATRLGQTKPSKKSKKPTPKYTVRKDGTLIPYKAKVVNTLTQLDRDDRLVPPPITGGDVPALKLRLSPSGFLMQIPSPLKKEKEVIEIMSSDDESVVMASSADGVAKYDSDGTVPSSLPPPVTGVYRPTEPNGGGGPGEETCVREVGEIWCGPPGRDARDRTADGGLADEVVWKYEG